MVIKMFNYSYGGWYDIEVYGIDDVIDLLDDGENRLPEENEIDKQHRDHMYTLEELEYRLENIKVFKFEIKGLYN